MKKPKGFNRLVTRIDKGQATHSEIDTAFDYLAYRTRTLYSRPLPTHSQLDKLMADIETARNNAHWQRVKIAPE